MIKQKCDEANDKDKLLILDYLQRNNYNVRTILDTGCSIGEFTMAVADVVKAEDVFGLEIEEGRYRQAIKRGVQLIAHDLNEPLPYNDRQFDLVVSRQVIEHLYHTDDYLDEVFRVLVPRGIFILTTVNFAAWHYRLMLLFGVQPIVMHPSIHQTWPLKGTNPAYGHKSLFTHKALKEVLIKHNFVIEKSYTHSIYFLPEFLCKIFPNLATFSCYILRKGDK